MGEENWAVAKPERQGNIFLWVPVSSPPQTHCHQEPESLGEGDGTDQNFPPILQPCNTAHLIGPAHLEGNSSPKSIQNSLASQLCPASWGTSGARGHLWDSLLHKEERGLLRAG